MRDFSFNISNNDSWLVAYYAYLFRKVSLQWYQDKRFLVLEELPCYQSGVVVFPYVELLIKDSSFQKLAEKLVSNKKVYEEKVPFEFSQFQEYTPFSSKFKVKPEGFSKVQEEILKLEIEHCIPTLEEVMAISIPSYTFNIIPTSIGTEGSWFRDRETIYVTVREDCIDQLAFRIMKTLIYVLLQNNDPVLSREDKWMECEAVVNRLLSNARLFGFVNKKSNLYITLNTDSFYDQYHEKSIMYLEKIGCLKLNKYEFDNTDIYINGSTLNYLSPAIRNLFKILIQNVGQVVSVDEICTFLYGDQSVDKFSLQYIAKLVEEARNILSRNGYPRKLISTHRKLGYKLG